MFQIHKPIFILFFVALLSSCAGAPLPQFAGPTAELEITTSTLKTRNVFYPDEKVRLAVFRMSDKERLGGEELTVQSPRKTVRLPTGTELDIRLFKSMALMGASTICISNAVVTFSADRRYRAVFDYDYNYDNPSESKCTSEMQALSTDGKLIETIPTKVSMSRNNVLPPLPFSAGYASSRKAVSVSPGKLFASSYINITAPSSEGWYLVQSSPSGMGFAKRGQAVNETFGAQVSMFNLPPTKTPEEFEALVKTSVEKDTDPNRFTVQQMSYEYSLERNYPCVRYHSVVKDKTPRGSEAPLLLESDALYCRHPIRTETGFAAIYSHRGGEPLYQSS